MESVKEILTHLNDSEGEDLTRQVQCGVPVRLPNVDWDETDPREMIDFPCSDTFLDHYHVRGLTPRHSMNFRGQRPDYKSYHFRKKQGGQRSGGVEM